MCNSKGKANFSLVQLEQDDTGEKLNHGAQTLHCNLRAGSFNRFPSENRPL
jgi:hypothetical protein